MPKRHKSEIAVSFGARKQARGVRIAYVVAVPKDPASRTAPKAVPIAAASVTAPHAVSGAYPEVDLPTEVHQKGKAAAEELGVC